MQVVKCKRRVKNCVDKLSPLCKNKETDRLFGLKLAVKRENINEHNAACRNKKTARLFGLKLSVIAHL